MSKEAYDNLSSVYDLWSQGDPWADECRDFYVDLCCQHKGTIVEIGVGTGRIAIEAALRGCQVMGIDQSENMLNICRQKMEKLARSIPLTLCNHDLNSSIDISADLIIIPFRTIGHFVSPEKVVSLLKVISKSLGKKGKLVFDHYNIDLEWAHTHDRIPRLMYQGPLNNKENENILIWDIYNYDLENSRMLCNVLIQITNLKGHVINQRYTTFPFYFPSVEDMYQMIQQANMKVINLMGSFGGDQYTHNSEQQIWTVGNC